MILPEISGLSSAFSLAIKLPVDDIVLIRSVGFATIISTLTGPDFLPLALSAELPFLLHEVVPAKMKIIRKKNIKILSEAEM
jgi:hypothetical protein